MEARITLEYQRISAAEEANASRQQALEQQAAWDRHPSLPPPPPPPQRPVNEQEAPVSAREAPVHEQEAPGHEQVAPGHEQEALQVNELFAPMNQQGIRPTTAGYTKPKAAMYHWTCETPIHVEDL